MAEWWPQGDYRSSREHSHRRCGSVLRIDHRDIAQMEPSVEFLLDEVSLSREETELIEEMKIPVSAHNGPTFYCLSLPEVVVQY